MAVVIISVSVRYGTATLSFSPILIFILIHTTVLLTSLGNPTSSRYYQPIEPQPYPFLQQPMYVSTHSPGSGANVRKMFRCVQNFLYYN